MTSVKYVQSRFRGEIECALQLFLCALVSRPVCARITHAHSLEGIQQVYAYMCLGAETEKVKRFYCAMTERVQVLSFKILQQIQ